MGVVYKAEDLRLNRPVALKFLGADAVRGDGKLRFLHEAQATALIHHPNICPVYDVDEVDGQLFLAMAYLDGRTIAQMLAEGPMTVDLALDLACQIAEGLKAAHEHGVIHRDIKSNNIVVNNKGTACILDFGLALRSGSTRITRMGSAIGAPPYMSPGQAQGLDLVHLTDPPSLTLRLF